MLWDTKIDVVCIDCICAIVVYGVLYLCVSSCNVFWNIGLVENCRLYLVMGRFVLHLNARVCRGERIGIIHYYSPLGQCQRGVELPHRGNCVEDDTVSP